MATGGDDGAVRLFNADTGHSDDAPLTGHGKRVGSVAFSLDGQILASASDDGTARLWSVSERRLIREFGDTGQVWSVALSPDGRRLAAGGQDGSVRLWDTATGDSVSASDSRHSGRVLAVVFSRDKTRLATASDDGTVRLWNADTGDPLGAPLTGHSNAVRSVAFNPDGQRLTSAGFDKAVRTWPAVATPEMLCDKLTINMSRAQWREWISDEPDIDYQKCQPLCSKLPRPPD